MIKRSGLTAAAGALVLLLTQLLSTACRAGGEGAAEAPVLRIGFGIGSTARDTSLPALTDLLYAEALLTREGDGRQTARLATRWQWEDAGRTLRMELKDGVLFHDGTPLTAAMVRDSLEGVISARHSAAVGFEYVTGIEAPDDRTILVKLSQPDIFLLTALSDRKIVHPKAADIATGPFTVVSRTPNVILERFQAYHGGPSTLSGVRILTYDTPRSVWGALMRREIDAAQEVSRDSVQFMAGSTDIRMYPSLQPFYVAMVFNQRHPALRHVAVRRALSSAIDRAAILDRALRGRGRVADGPVWPLHWAYEGTATTLAYTPENSRLQLDHAGFPLPTSGPPGELRKRMAFRCLVYNEDPLYERIALLVQRQLFDIGVDMSIELVDMETFQSRAASGEFDAFLMRTNSGRSLDVAYRFWHSSRPGRTPLQNSGYTGADDPLDRLRVSTTEDEVRASVAALARRFYDDAPAAFLVWLEVTRAVDTRFTVGDSRTQDPFANIWQWRFAGHSDASQ